MKRSHLTTIFSSFLFITILCPSIIYAQDYTRWDLPEDAIARLGKGRISDMQYSPDGARLAVATSIGIWVYDANNLSRTPTPYQTQR